MENIMVFLNKKFSFLTKSKLLVVVIRILIYLNPIALFPQLMMVVTADDLTGVSSLTWLLFAFIQLAMIFEAIKIKNSPIFLSMLISFVESVIIFAIIWLKN